MAKNGFHITQSAHILSWAEGLVIYFLEVELISLSLSLSLSLSHKDGMKRKEKKYLVCSVPL